MIEMSLPGKEVMQSCISLIDRSLGDWETFLNLYVMYTLNFPNGNVQTYASYNDLLTAARLMGGEAKIISGKSYAFVPKK